MPATSIEPAVTLTEEQIDFFHREGYLKLDSITDQVDLIHQPPQCRDIPYGIGWQKALPSSHGREFLEAVLFSCL